MQGSRILYGGVWVINLFAGEGRGVQGLFLVTLLCKFYNLTPSHPDPRTGITNPSFVQGIIEKIWSCAELQWCCCSTFWTCRLCWWPLPWGYLSTSSGGGSCTGYPQDPGPSPSLEILKVGFWYVKHVHTSIKPVYHSGFSDMTTYIDI